MWWELPDGTFINSNFIISIKPVSMADGSWRVEHTMINGELFYGNLYKTEKDAIEAIRTMFELEGIVKRKKEVNKNDNNK